MSHETGYGDWNNERRRFPPNLKGTCPCVLRVESKLKNKIFLAKQTDIFA
jgi:hypothetical protein